MKYVREEKLMKQFGKRIRALRTAQSISQGQLAFEASISTMQVSRIERGEINTSVSVVFRIAKALDVPVKDLFDF